MEISFLVLKKKEEVDPIELTTFTRSLTSNNQYFRLAGFWLESSKCFQLIFIPLGKAWLLLVSSVDSGLWGQGTCLSCLACSIDGYP